jgi:hypothetical protein
MTNNTIQIMEKLIPLAKNGTELKYLIEETIEGIQLECVFFDKYNTVRIIDKNDIISVFGYEFSYPEGKLINSYKSQDLGVFNKENKI